MSFGRVHPFPGGSLTRPNLANLFCLLCLVFVFNSAEASGGGGGHGGEGSGSGGEAESSGASSEDNLSAQLLFPEEKGPSIFTRVRYDQSREEFLAPVSFKKAIDKVFFDHVVMSREADSKSNKVSLDVPKRFFEYKLRLRSNNPKTFNGKSLEILYPKGGGVLDFADFEIEPTGQLQLQWVFPTSLSTNPQFRVFFLSNGKERKIHGLTYGSGCNSFGDITSFFFSRNRKEGLKVPVSSKRYVSLLAGTFLFVQPAHDALLVAQLIVRDRNSKSLQCRL